MTPCMDFYKAQIKYYGSLDKLKLRILVRVDLQNEELFGDTWSPTASMRNLKYFLEDNVKNKVGLYQLYIIVSFLQVKVKDRVSLKLDSRYADYFQNIQITLEELLDY